MKKKIKRIALALALVQLLLLFTACGPEEKPTTEGTTAGTPTTEAPTTGNKVETPSTEEVTTTIPNDDGIDRLCLVENGTPRYKLVNGTTASTEMNEMVRDFNAAVEELTGVTFDVILDSYLPEEETEICFGAFLHRDDAKAVRAATSYTEYRIESSGERIVFSAYHYDHYDSLYNYFLRAIYEEEGNWYVDVDMINVSKEYHPNYKAPLYETVSGRVQGAGIYYSMEDTAAITYEKTNREEYEAYQEKLVSLGYTKYFENVISPVEFVTYTMDNHAVHLQFRPDVKEVTINFIKDQFLPATEPAEYTAVTRTSATYIQRVGYDGWGLSMILQLADGTFIIVDGGKSHATDMNNMIKFMKDNKPASHEKPIVSLWLLTHPHEDHVEMFAYNAKYFKAHIELKMLGYNFPIEPCTEVDATGRYWNEYYHHAIEAQRAAHFPDAITWTGHTGQKLYLADAEIEVLYTHEDYYPGAIYSANDCNTNYRISVDGVSMMVLGDSDRGNELMTTMYGNTLRAEMVQAAHHGTNGPAQMYITMDPKVVFWPHNETQIKTVHWTYPANVSWVNTPWIWTDENGQQTIGERRHITASKTETVYFDEFAK